MKTLTRNELKRMNELEHEDFVLINVLPRDVFKQDHIRTSVNVPVDSEDFAQTVDRISGGKNRKIVVYCASFDCNASSKAAKTLAQAGFTQVYDYEGGTKDWNEQKQAA